MHIPGLDDHLDWREDEHEAHVCPECEQGKCRNCDGTAWCNDLDEPVACDCDHEG